ncbi:HpcH/HpaI aldolase/citrate lyase family protein [Thioalkalivibrio sp. HK1]|uniref:HpcH/HpaI aldolase/citrate lyase family protein n=1 Tax=Thioalkalivibrio sp. HK1 TaxID=1469245 RepID=UPI00047058DA|nr:CoA ester lyase [Thioalkalivibrio sp. HK1]
MSFFRSMLFAPGNHPRRVEKALDLEVDSVILDLEDAVAINEKILARSQVAKALSRPRKGSARVRINAFETPFCVDDLRAVAVAGLDGIVLAKVESAAQLVAVDWLLRALERERGLVEGGIDLMPIIETAASLSALREIAACGLARVRRLSFGAADLTLDLGMRWTRDEHELDSVRTRIVIESKAAGLEAPVDTVFARLGDPQGLCASARRARDLGFQGKLCIHPEQIDPVNTLFTPDGEEVAHARRIIAAFESAEAEGSASIRLDGQFIDYPIVERARRIVDIAQQRSTMPDIIHR